MVEASHRVNNPSAKMGSKYQLAFLYIKFFLEMVLLALYTLYSFGVSFLRFFFPPEPKSVKNEVVLVTGGANGIGREICLQLARLEPYITIISWDVNETANEHLIKELKAHDVKKAYGYKVDVSNRQEVEAAAKVIRDEIGHVTMLFNNAGIPGLLGNSWDMNPQGIERVFQVNTIAHCWTLAAFLPSMIERGRGHVIETCSILGYTWGRSAAPYVASKHALKGYIESVKEDIRYNKANVTVSLVYPHNTITDLTAQADLSAKTYPFLMPRMTPGFVASKIIEGVRRNDEHIYIPGYIRSLAMLIPALPPQVVRRITDIINIEMAPRVK